MNRRVRITLAGVGLWYGAGLGHDLLVREDVWSDVPYGTVRCDGRLLNALSWGERTCVGDLRGSVSWCERTVRSGCDVLFPAGPLLTVYVPPARPPSRALANVELTAMVVCAKVTSGQ